MSCNCPTCNKTATTKGISEKEISEPIDFINEIGYCPKCRKEFINSIPRKEYIEKLNKQNLIAV